MNKAEKMKKLALSMKDLFKKKGSLDDKRVYHRCLRYIKTNAAKGKLKLTFHVNMRNYNNLNVETVAEWLENDGFEVILTPFYPDEIDEDVEDIEDWEMKVSWE